MDAAARATLAGEVLELSIALITLLFSVLFTLLILMVFHFVP